MNLKIKKVRISTYSLKEAESKYNTIAYKIYKHNEYGYFIDTPIIEINNCSIPMEAI